MNETKDLSPNEIRMATEHMPSLVIKYAIPTIIGMIVNALYNVIDRFWVGQMPNIGPMALTGLGLTMPLSTILMGFAQLVGLGAATCISIYLGQREKDKAERILGNSLVFVVITAIFITIFGSIFLEDILWKIGASERTIPFALDYSRIIIAGCIFQQISFAMNHPIRATGNAKRFASTQLLGGILNMILDPIFIFNFDMGIQGAAVATIISQCVSAIWVLSFYATEKSILKIKRKNMKPSLEIMKRVYSLGFSPFFMQIAASVVTIFINRQLIYYGAIEFGDGDLAVAAMTIINSIAIIFFMPVVGINQGMTPIVGFNFGAGDYGRMKAALRWAVTYAVIICTVGLIIIQVFPTEMAGIFSDDASLLQITPNAMRIYLSSLMFIGVQAPCAMFFQAIGRARMSIFLSLLRQVIMLLPLYYMIPAAFGFHGIWFAGPIADVLSTTVTVFFVFREIKILNKSPQKSSTA